MQTITNPLRLSAWRRIADEWRCALQASWRAARADRLEDLDERTLRDIGLTPSEIGSVDAEWRGLSRPTRRRIARAT